MDGSDRSSDAIGLPPSCGVGRRTLYQPMVLIVGVMILGICWDRYLDSFFLTYVSVGLGAISLWLGTSFAWRRWRSLPAKPWLDLLSLTLYVAIGCFGALWHHIHWNWVGRDDLARFANETPQLVCVEALVTSELRWQAVDEGIRELNPIPKGERTRVEIMPLRIRDGRSWRAVSGRTYLTVLDHCDHFRSGDQIRIFGRLTSIRGPTNPGQFDFRHYYRCRRVYASVHATYPDSVRVIGRPTSLSTNLLLSLLRRKLNETTWNSISPQRAGLASAILLGNREQLVTSRRESFLVTGTVHLLAISGLHVGILSGIFFLLFRLGIISRNVFLILTILFVCFYAWLVEFRAPVSRAAILIVLLCIGRLRGHSILSYNWLAAAAMVVLLLNPSELFQVGTQLSFMAVATITFGRTWIFRPPSDDPIQRLIANTRPIHVRGMHWVGRQIRVAFLVSSLIWLVAMPMVAFRFHLVAPIALLVNPVLLLPIAFALYGGLGVLVFGWFSNPIGTALALMCDWNLKWIERIIGFSQQVPLSHVWTTGPSIFAVVVFYIGIFVLALFSHRRGSGKRFLIFVWLWIVFAWWMPSTVSEHISRESKAGPTVTFLDVGHGTSVLIEFPDGKNLLYDAGCFGSASFGARTIASALWSQGVEHLDAVVVSHADLDHFNALPQLVDRFSIGVVYLSPIMASHQSESVQHLFSSLDQNKVRIQTIRGGDVLRSGLTYLSVLSPPDFGTGKNDNSDSIVMLVEHDGRSVLLTGDLEGTGMDLLLSLPPLTVDILMAPHHGSSHSAPAALAAWCRPKSVVISGSQRKVEPQVEKIFEQSGARLFRTGHDGAVSFEFRESDVKVQTYQSARF